MGWALQTGLGSAICSYNVYYVKLRISEVPSEFSLLGLLLRNSLFPDPHCAARESPTDLWARL